MKGNDMKKDKTFKMWKTTKYLMSTIVDKDARNHYKNMMIDAQIAAQTPPPKKEKKPTAGVVVAGIEIDT